MKRTPIKRKSKTSLAKTKERLWQECRRIILQKYGNTCYTCGRTGLQGSNCHVGHFISSSVCSGALRYDLDNLRPQCYSCNIHKSGNWIAYEEHLTEEKGPNFVAELKKRNQETKGLKYDEIFYQNLINDYEKTT